MNKWQRQVKVRCRRTLGLACAATLLTASILAVEVRADITFGFDNITNNDPGDAAIGEAQLFVTVSDFGVGQVLFTFTNIGPLASSITDVYFDNGSSDGSLYGIAGLIDSDDGIGGDPDVDFTPPATPSNLPGGLSLSPVFTTTQLFSADADSPVGINGVNPDQWLGVIFNLQDGNFLVDVLADLESAQLRIGIHVQAFAGEGSEGFINPPVPIPAPGAVALGAMGLAAVAWVKRRSGRASDLK